MHPMCTSSIHDQVTRYNSCCDTAVYSSHCAVQFDPCSSAQEHDPCEMFLRHPVQQLSHLEDLKLITPSFEEDDEMAAARDVVTADLKCFQEALTNCSTPPPAMHPFPGTNAHQRHNQPQQQVYMKQEASGGADSTCGASSPQVSCDTAAVKAQQFWAPQQPQQQQHYDAAAYSFAMGHSPVNEYAGPLHAYGSMGPMGAAGPCTGPCCNPGLMPQGSCSLPPLAPSGVASMGDFAALSGSYGPGAYSAAAMVPQGDSCAQFRMRSSYHPLPPAMAVAQPPPQPQQQLPRAHSTYPPTQGGVQKKVTGSKGRGAPAPRRSGDGSCSSKDGAPTPVPTKAKKGKAAAATAASAGPASRSRGSANGGSHAAAAAAVAAGGSAASLIKELQQEVDVLSASKIELKSQVRNLINSQTDLLSRVATITTKWQQAVAENAALQRQITLMAGQGI